ncbi:MAG: hypothetical protein ACREQV_13110, partial [Candidatus Binatia bacterium]
LFHGLSVAACIEQYRRDNEMPGPVNTGFPLLGHIDDDSLLRLQSFWRLAAQRLIGESRSAAAQFCRKIADRVAAEQGRREQTLRRMSEGMDRQYGPAWSQLYGQPLRRNP